MLAWVPPGYYWLLHAFGVDQGGPSYAYNFWSGAGSDFGELTLLAALGGMIVSLFALNCHKKGCWRVCLFKHHRHPVDGTDGHHFTCHHHFTPEDHQELHDSHAAKHPGQHGMAVARHEMRHHGGHSALTMKKADGTPLHPPASAKPTARARKATGAAKSTSAKAPGR